jgi:hypothetical protein
MTKSRLRRAHTRWYAMATVTISNKLCHLNNAYPLSPSSLHRLHPRIACSPSATSSSSSAASTKRAQPPCKQKGARWGSVGRAAPGRKGYRLHCHHVERSPTDATRRGRSCIFESPLSSIVKIEPPFLCCPLEKRSMMNSAPSHSMWDPQSPIGWGQPYVPVPLFSVGFIYVHAARTILA